METITQIHNERLWADSWNSPIFFVKLSIRVVLILMLTSLLFCGFGLTCDNSSAFAEGSNQLTQNTKARQSKLPKAITNAILRDASNRSTIPIHELKISQATRKTFSNPCRFKFGEICTQEYNPIQGWEVVVQVGDQSWTYHADKSGSQIVLDPKNSKDS